jgi:hypothetical protein
LNVLLVGPAVAASRSAKRFRIMDIIILFMEKQVPIAFIDAAARRAVSLAV